MTDASSAETKNVFKENFLLIIIGFVLTTFTFLAVNNFDARVTTKHHFQTDVEVKSPVLNTKHEFPTSNFEIVHEKSEKDSIQQKDPIVLKAEEALKVKGYLEQYSNTYKEISTSGNYYVYVDNYTDNCYRHDISLKYEPSCGDGKLPSRFVRRLLVVAVQRSGTHYIWEMLHRLKVHTHHEGVGPDATVSWFYAVNAEQRFNPRVKSFVSEYEINNPEMLTGHRFRFVFHQVRHPLRVISTLVKRCGTWDRYWKWINKIKGFNSIKKNQTALTRGMLLFILWNKHIEKYADIRFRTEDTSPRDVCRWAGFDIKKQCSYATVLKPGMQEVVEPVSAVISRNSNTERRLQSNSSSRGSVPRMKTQDRRLSEVRKHEGVTWEQLDAENLELSEEIKVMCLEYGFPLNPDDMPQNRASSQFTA